MPKEVAKYSINTPTVEKARARLTPKQKAQKQRRAFYNAEVKRMKNPDNLKRAMADVGRKKPKAVAKPKPANKPKRKGLAYVASAVKNRNKELSKY